MTISYEKIETPPVDVQREKPKITEELDRPFRTPALSGASYSENNFTAFKQAKDLEHSYHMDNFKNDFAKNLIIWCLIALAVMVIVGTIVQIAFNVEIALLTNSFEALKLIMMTAIGFVFGVKHS